MTDSGAKTHGASTGLRLIMAGTGMLFIGGSVVLLYAVARLLTSGLESFEMSGHDQLFWVLCGVVALCLLMLGVNFVSAAWRRRSHNIVPGPTLYLLGVTLVILGMFMAVGGAWLSALALIIAGTGCMRLEYRSEFI